MCARSGGGAAGTPHVQSGGRAVRAPCRQAWDAGARGKTECRRGCPDVRALALPFSFESTSYKMEHVIHVFVAYMHMDDCGHCRKLCQYKVSCPHHRLNEPLLCLWHRHHPLSPAPLKRRQRSRRPHRPRQELARPNATWSATGTRVSMSLRVWWICPSFSIGAAMVRRLGSPTLSRVARMLVCERP
jgi:hypothetical protein